MGPLDGPPCAKDAAPKLPIVHSYFKGLAAALRCLPLWALVLLKSASWAPSLRWPVKGTVIYSYITGVHLRPWRLAATHHRI